ncbi:siderophore-interacting protein [Thalassotalea euphylliae]|uniref:Siderophore-interacting protein n=1 Tax=Thalassotalea euphylliae TaxID=1655234 RepID=A0A3E0TWP0_9GAMM|nr:siderophore-interacting protein [Thalassotalea euphylliae]REL28879.1 siderophore-interacting protein [Thalassotalea euphylliae]
MTRYTQLKDLDHKLDIIDHVNQDHSEQLLAIAQHQHPDQRIASARLSNVVHEGIEIIVYIEDNHCRESTETIFVAFDIDGDLEEKILYLAYAAVVQQGRDFSGTGKRFFEVTNKQNITTNMVRLTVKSSTPLPEHYPGYACAFVLKTLNKVPKKAALSVRQKPRLKQLFDQFFIWLVKRLSSSKRQQLLSRINHNIRLYTLRKVWSLPPENPVREYGYIDIFTHDNSPGSQWVKELTVGNIIVSRSETEDQHRHLNCGHALLIADETAYPALAGILECWQNPIPPQVIVISTDQAEQPYFSDEQLRACSKYHRLVCPPTEQGQRVIGLVQQLTNIDVVWGALESSAAKSVRHYLRNERGITGRNNHTKGYWHLSKSSK